MTPPISIGAYLDAKRALDERSLHGPTWRAYLSALERFREGAPTAPAVLELGPGLGSMLDRTLRSFGGPLDYLAVDRSEEYLATLRSRFSPEADGERLRNLETRAGDALEELAGLAADGRRFHAVVSHAFIDLADIPRVARAAAAVLVPGGIFYNSLVFDGATAFPSAPGYGDEEDGTYVAAYHRTMRRPWDGAMPPEGTADGRSGSRLLALVRNRPWNLLDAGGSDWTVAPRRLRGRSEGSDDEDLVIERMLQFFEESAETDPDGADRGAFRSWLDRKRAALRDGALGLFVRHADALAELRG